MIEIKAKREFLTRTIDLYVLQTGNGIYNIGTDVRMEAVEDGMYHQPTLRLGETEAQALMDELWHCGLRPTEGSGSAGSLAATERHLKDMQQIAMGLLRKSGTKL